MGRLTALKLVGKIMGIGSGWLLWCLVAGCMVIRG
jgi:hypothetical protein